MEGEEINPPKVLCDPGWNDPPLFSYDATKAAGQQKKGTLLNKRVAFPLSVAAGTSSIPSPVHSPLTPQNVDCRSTPPHACRPPSSPCVSTDTSSSTVTAPSTTVDKTDALAKVLANFEDVINSHSADLQKNKDEIHRRLGIMKKMWEEDKLNTDIHNRMLELSEALKSGDGTTADGLHIGLMVNHVALCSSWMVGVRQMIHCVKSVSSTSSEDTSY